MIQHAYLHFKASPEGPFTTLRVPLQETEAPKPKSSRHIPTRYKVRFAGRWWRVHWNPQTPNYIGPARKPLALVQQA